MDGWGRNLLVGIDYEKQKIIFRHEHSVEGRYQKEMGSCYGSALMAGKFAGWGNVFLVYPDGTGRKKILPGEMSMMNLLSFLPARPSRENLMHCRDKETRG